MERGSFDNDPTVEEVDFRLLARIAFLGWLPTLRFCSKIFHQLIKQGEAEDQQTNVISLHLLFLDLELLQLE